MEKELGLIEALIEQFGRGWQMVRAAVEATPDTEWKVGEDDYLIPVRLVYHIIQCAERYASNLSSAEYERARRYALDWLGTPEPMPDRAATLDALDWLEERTSVWLRDLGSEGLMAEEIHYPYAGRRVLDRALYLLRHTLYHIGELSAESHRRGYYQDVWK